MSSYYKEPTDLYEAVLLLANTEEVHNFFKDLCTPQEIAAMQERWKVCQLLDDGQLSYREIHAITGASITTVGRVARFLKDEPYRGYRKVLDKIKNNKGR